MSSCSVTSSTSSSSGFCSTSCFRICCSSSVGTCRSLSACWSRGVMMSFCVCDRCSECCISMADPREALEGESFAQIVLACQRVLGQLLRRTGELDAAIEHDVRAIGGVERDAHVVVGDQQSQAARAQPPDD